MALFTGNPDLLIAAPMLQDYFVDKDTGLPLSGGFVTCFQDDSRTTYKNWFYQTGTPGAYTYETLPNPLTLTASGTINDGNNPANDVIPFFYPYDDNQVAQPYYITVQNSGSVGQFTRENFPFVAGGGIVPPSDQQSIVNLWPNPQFTAHTNLPNQTGLFPNGAPSIVVAPGGFRGWEYVKPDTSTDTDFITFDYLAQEPASLTGNPRWAVRVSCTATSGGDTQKSLAMAFSNVNHFESLTDYYTISFAAKSNSVSPVDITLFTYKFFGTASADVTPSDPDLQALITFTVTPGEYNQYSFTYQFPENSPNFTIGENNDDYIAIGVGFPVGDGATFNVSLTNFFIANGTYLVVDYPDVPDNDRFSTGVAGSMPIPDPTGMDLYLPIIYTPTGFGFDNSRIGKIYASDTVNLSISEISLNGQSFIGSDYSSDGIPYARLQNYYLDNGYTAPAISGLTYQIPKYGTGFNFVTAFISTNTTGAGSYLYISSNSYNAGNVAVVDGASPSGFTVPVTNDSTETPSEDSSIIVTSGGPSPGVLSFLVLRSVVFNTTALPVAPPFVLNGGGVQFVSTTYKNSNAFAPNAIGTPLVWSLTAWSSTLSDYTSGGLQWANPNQVGSYYFYYMVNGVGTDPAPGGGILLGVVNLVTGDTVTDIIYKTECFLQGGFITGIQAPVSPTPGGYMTWTVASQDYALWFTVNGVGTAPVLSNTILIECAIPSGTFTAPQIAYYAAQAINTYSYSVPNLQGMTLRGIDPGAVWDADVLFRTSFGNNALTGAIPGTLEYGIEESHTHPLTVAAGGAPDTSVQPGTNSTTQGPIGNAGGSETRSVNISVNWVTQY